MTIVLGYALHNFIIDNARIDHKNTYTMREIYILLTTVVQELSMKIFATGVDYYIIEHKVWTSHRTTIISYQNSNSLIFKGG